MHGTITRHTQVGIDRLVCNWHPWRFSKNKVVPGEQVPWVGIFNSIPNGKLIAFTLVDIVFKDAGGNTISHRNAIANRSAIKRVTIRWRWWKNGQWVETKSYSKPIHDIKLDAVEAWPNIVDRSYRLMPKNKLGEPKTDPPVAVFRYSKSAIQNITDSRIEKTMCTLVKSVYGITTKKQLAKFTCHSIRVGACCIFQAAGASPDNIKKQLRWNIDSWMIYNRDLCILAHHQHNEIMFNK